MSGFAADWLALREPADRSSRSAAVLQAASDYFSATKRDVLRICDLGSGTGASVSAFSHLFAPPQSWCLVDYDAGNLDRALVRYRGEGAIDGVHVETRSQDLTVNVAPWDDGADLITATALFDLTSPEWLQSFADELAAQQLPLLTTLTFDGRHVLRPVHELDEDMCVAFNVHQRGDKGFGPAAGPDAVVVLADVLKRHGYTVVTGDSTWHLSAEQYPDLINEIISGWAGAVIERDLVPENRVRAWERDRMENTSSLQVGHTDVFAAPTA